MIANESISMHAASGTPAYDASIRIEAMNTAGRRIQELTAQIESLPDPSTRALFQECMEATLSFYGHGLERILELTTDISGSIHPNLVNDSAVRGLLLVHGLHPLDLHTRLQQALEKVRPYMESHGGNVELLSLEDDYARLRLQGSCKSCASSVTTLELAVRQSIEEHCPDLLGFEVEGAETLSAAPTPKHSGWVVIPQADALEEGALMPVQRDGLPLLICRVHGRLYAYRDRCPVCNTPLHLGTLDLATLTCCEGHRFDVTAAGLSPDNPHFHLEPMPLLVEDGAVKLAYSVS